MEKFRSFQKFYPFYLSQHQHPACRALHVLGSSAVLITFVFALISRNYWPLLSLPVLGYAPAWIGHFFFEKNRPATFQYPLYSLIGDWVMWKDFFMKKFRRSRSS